jgi:hypothetical protein
MDDASAVTTPIDGLLDSWATAERRGDVTRLRSTLDAAFTAVSADGTVFDRQQWLDRYRTGELVNDAFEWRTWRWSGRRGIVVAVGDLEQISSYRGRDASAVLTLAVVADRWRWRLIGLHATARRGRWVRR